MRCCQGFRRKSLQFNAVIKWSFHTAQSRMYFWPSLKVCSKLTYGCSPVCPRLRFRQSCASGWAATVTVALLQFSPPNELAACPVSHVPMTFAEDCCGPSSPALVALSGVSLSGWPDKEQKQTGRAERTRCRQEKTWNRAGKTKTDAWLWGKQVQNTKNICDA